MKPYLGTPGGTKEILKKYGFDFIYKSFLFIIDMAAPLYHALL